jgi:hypothetical protein
MSQNMFTCILQYCLAALCNICFIALMPFNNSESCLGALFSYTKSRQIFLCPFEAVVSHTCTVKPRFWEDNILVNGRGLFKAGSVLPTLFCRELYDKNLFKKNQASLIQNLANFGFLAICEVKILQKVCSKLQCIYSSCFFSSFFTFEVYQHEQKLPL